MAIFTVKDANNKDFTVDTNNIFNINGDITDSTNGNISDSMRKNRLLHVHDVEYFNSNGETIDSQQIIRDYESGDTNILGLDVEMEATHSGDNHNYCIYYEDSMENDCESFINPFQKPVLKNHNSYDGEPLGRCQKVWSGPSELTSDRSAIHIKARITDKDSYVKFLDGRYKTVSISGTMGTVTCNICGKTILKDGKFNFCGHWRGETYKDKVCYWGAKDIEYHEVSTVNTPADDYAQIMKVTVLTDKDEKNKDSKEENQMDGNNTTANATTTVNDNIAEQMKNSVNDIIDQLLNSSKPVVEDNTQQQKNQTTNTTNTTEDSQAQKDPNKTEDSVNVEEVLKTLEDTKQELESVKSELQTLKDSLNTKEEELKSIKEECDSYKEKCLALASANKELTVDSIISKENLDEDKIEDRKNELLQLSMKELDALKSQPIVPKQREMAHVDNPTLGVEQKDARDNNSTNNTDVHNTADTIAKNKTVDDFAMEIVGKLYK